MSTSENKGLVSTKEKDYLDEDKAIRGQNYYLVSFISPEDVLCNKETYYFSKFMEQFGKDMNTLFQGLSNKYPDSSEIITNIQNNHLYLSDPKEMNEQYSFFKSVNSESIESDFHRDNDFQTTTRGIKIRGVFDTLEEAKLRSEFLKKMDDKFYIYIGQVGCWCPWSPNPNDIQEQEYSESQLNTLMKKYKENMEHKDEIFEKRKQEAISISKNTQETDVSELANDLEKIDPWTERKEEEENSISMS